MIKKIRVIVISMAIVLGITACGKENISDDSKTNSNSSQQVIINTDEERKSDNDNILIAYFTRVGNTNFPDNVDANTSASLNKSNDDMKGNTQIVAEMIQKSAGGDLFLIQTKEKYAADYNSVLDDAQKEKSNDTHPKLASKFSNMDQYDVIFIGFPNWWSDMPMSVYSFFDEYDLAGKTIIPFCTSGGSGFSNNIETIKELETEAIVLDGLSINDSEVMDSKQKVEQWIMGLGLN